MEKVEILPSSVLYFLRRGVLTMKTNGTSIEDFTSLFDQNTKRAETVVCDWDAVIQLIEETWFLNLLHLKLTNPTHKLALTIDFSKFTEEDGSISHRKIISRPTYYLTD